MKRTVTVGVQEETLERITLYRKNNPGKSLSEVVEDLLNIGLSEVGA